MSELGEAFCLVCGAPPPLFGERMCEPCFRKRVKLAEVPENVPWVRCARCGIVELQGKWVNISEEEVWDELIQRNLKFHVDARKFYGMNRPEFYLSGTDTKFIADIEIRIRQYLSNEEIFF